MTILRLAAATVLVLAIALLADPADAKPCQTRIPPSTTTDQIKIRTYVPNRQSATITFTAVDAKTNELVGYASSEANTTGWRTSWFSLFEKSVRVRVTVKWGGCEVTRTVRRLVGAADDPQARVALAVNSSTATLVYTGRKGECLRRRSVLHSW